MARIAGVDLPRDKRGEIAIQYIYGIGTPSARKIFADARVDPNKRVKAWSDDETSRVREILEREYKVEGDLRWMVVTTGVATIREKASGKKSAWLWMRSNSPARSNTCAMWSISHTLASIAGSSE